LAILVVVLMIAPIVLAACAPTEPEVVVETVVVEQTRVVEVEGTPQTVVETTVVEVTVPPPATAEPEPMPEPGADRMGAWPDRIVMIVENSAEAAVTRLAAGEMDVYAYGVNDPNVFETVKANPDLKWIDSFGSYTELTMNVSGPTFTDGRLNPFSNPKIREAMNWLIDRDYIVQEIYGGLGRTKLTTLNSAFPDYSKYVGKVRELEAKYAYDLDKANEVVTAEMEAMGAELVDGKWNYNGAPVVLIYLIRTEDERTEIGDYVASQLEAIGFTVDRQYKTRSEASPLWVQSDPAEGLWVLYTGGWITTAISRDDGSNFSFFYTPRDYPIPLWQAYTPDPAFDEVALKLRNNDFKTMEEREELFNQALEMSLMDSARVWQVDALGFSPLRAEVSVTGDLAGGISGSQIWGLTIKKGDVPGGTIRVAQPGLLVDPWNPVAGSNWIYDMMPIRSTQDYGAVYDPYTGLTWPMRVESATVTVQEDLPVTVTNDDWLTLDTAAEITVPDDAWVDWDATNQVWITAAEKFTETQTALTKTTVTYPADLFEKIKWHDGSPISLADFVMGMIIPFDTGKPESAIYDEAAGETLAAFLDHAKGFKIVSTDPLTIETYDDLWYLDAELIAYANTWWPNYAYGPGAWHNIGIGVLAEEAGLLAFSAAKADTAQIEWMSYVAGPSLEILSDQLDAATAANHTPYTPTLGAYITPEEATERYANLNQWYAEQGHFWLGTGPFYVDKVFPVEGTLTLNRNENYPDPFTRWARFGEPKIAVVEVDGPGVVTIGEEAVYDVFVTYQDEPYPQDEIATVKWLLFDATGVLAASGDAEAVADGQYAVTLPADVTGNLEAGSNRLEVAVASLVVSIPSFDTLEFVTE
jgi:peptide/nickel transport system substrate-binding protein